MMRTNTTIKGGVAKKKGTKIEKSNQMNVFQESSVDNLN